MLVIIQNSNGSCASFTLLVTKMNHTHKKHNWSKYYIRILKRRWRQRKIRKYSPKRLWDFGVVWEAHTITRNAPVWDKIPGLEQIAGGTVDIRECFEFEFYGLFWYWDTPHDWYNPNIEWWLGVSRRVGRSLCYWILNLLTKILS